MRGAADAAGEDAGEPLHRLDRRLVVDEQRRGPVAARHDARQVHHQADIDAGEIDRVEMPVVDADAGPGLAAAFGRRMLAERQHAGAEHRAIARQRHLAFQRPRFSQRLAPQLFLILSSDSAHRPMRDERDVTMKATPARISTTPTPCVKRLPVPIFSIVITMPSAGHPDHVHDADREHHQHHRPAAAETEQALLDAEPEHAARRGRPVGEEERERLPALRAGRRA